MGSGEKVNNSARKRVSSQTEIPALHDVEGDLLGAVMQSPDLWDPAIREECFSTDLTQKVFREVCAMRERREPPELAGVVINLRASNQINAEDVPVVASWGDHLCGVPTTQASLRKMVSSLLDCYARREVLKAGETAHHAADRTKPLADVLRQQKETTERLQALARGNDELDRGLDGTELLDELSRFIQRFVWLTDAQATVLALWVIHTHALAAADLTPYLSITSAEKQSGKTRLLEVLKLFVANPWFTGRTSAAALVRKIASEGPTLLLDETDATFKQNQEYTEALRGILNSGYARGGCATLCVGKGSEQHVEDLPTFGAKALAGLGRLPDTLSDRSIPIALKRKIPGAHVERFRRRQVEPAGRALAHKCASWAQEHLEVLKNARPELPESLSDRRQDVVEPLLAIADQAEGDWPSRARISIAQIFDGPGSEDQSIRVQLLADIRMVFEERQTDKMATDDLIEALEKFESSPWAELNHGKRISRHGLSRLLRPFQIAPRGIRLGDQTPRGYRSDQFQEAWSMYLPSHSPNQTATSQQSSIHAGRENISNRNTAPHVADQKHEESPVFTRDVAMLRSETGNVKDGEKQQREEEIKERLFTRI
jgi:Protein of unknown function (DUF3631)